MPEWVWRGVTSKKLYRWMPGVIPAAMVDVYGQPKPLGTYNNESLVLCNRDGSVALSVASGPPPGASTVALPYGGNDVYSSYVSPGLWEQQT